MKKTISIIIVSLFFLFGCSNATENDIKNNDEVEQVSKTVEKNDLPSESEDDISSDSKADEIETESVSESDEITSEKYVEVIMAVYNVYDADIKLITEYFAQAEADTSLYKNEQWISKINESLSRISSAYALLKGMSEKGIVPTDYEEVHNLTKAPFSTMEVVKSMFVGEDVNREILSTSYLTTIQLSIDEMLVSNNKLREKINE